MGHCHRWKLDGKGQCRKDSSPVKEGFGEAEGTSSAHFWLRLEGQWVLAPWWQCHWDQLSGPGAVQPQRKGLVWAGATVPRSGGSSPSLSLCVTHGTRGAGRLRRAFPPPLLGGPAGLRAVCCQQRDKGDKEGLPPGCHHSCASGLVAVGQLQPFLVGHPAL